MKIRAWRIVKEKYQGDAFTGEGARKYGGRWNSTGTPIVYASESLSLATLEILAGGISIPQLGTYVKIPVDFDSSLVEYIKVIDLPDDWTSYPPGIQTQGIGDVWVKENRSALLRVPSVVIMEEFNYLINPGHPDFKKVVVGKAERLSVDRRVVRGD